MKVIKLFWLIFILLISCEYEKPAYRFSNFNGTQAEDIAKAIKNENTDIIRREIKENEVNIDFKDKKYEVSLLTLAMINDKKDAFNELLELGANPNINNSYCVSPLISAIRNNKNCNLYYINRLLESGANITPNFFKKCNYFSYDPINEVVQQYSDEEKISCGLRILNLLVSKLNDPDLLFKYNNKEDYQANVVYLCLSTRKNLSALKHLIIDLGYKVPDKIFIDGTVISNKEGFFSLKEVLQDKEMVFEYSNLREQAKQDLLIYLKDL